MNGLAEDMEALLCGLAEDKEYERTCLFGQGLTGGLAKRRGIKLSEAIVLRTADIERTCLFGHGFTGGLAEDRGAHSGKARCSQ